MGKKLVKIEYNGKEFYIAALVEYKGVKYYYIVENVYKPGIDFDNLKEDLNVEVNFIYKLDNGLYQNVGDEELFNKLLKLANIDYISNGNPFLNIDDEV